MADVVTDSTTSMMNGGRGKTCDASGGNAEEEAGNTDSEEEVNPGGGNKK